MNVAIQTILIAGLICGVLDAFSAVAASGWRFVRVWQFVASSLLGPGSYQQGNTSVAIGLGLHFTVATSWSAVYYFLSRKISFLLDHALVSGILYGIVVHVIMSQVLVPLTAIGRRPFSLNGFLTQLVVHMIVVGPSIALTIKHYSR